MEKWVGNLILCVCALGFLVVVVIGLMVGFGL